MRLNSAPHRIRLYGPWVLTLLALCFFGSAQLCDAAESAVEKVETSVAQTTESVKGGLDHLWQQIDASRLKNRTPDELAAWVIMGVLVGALAGMATAWKPTGIGVLGRLGLGLAGAFIGGIATRVSQLDLGLGPVLIRYEDLLFSFIGAIVLILGSRFLRSTWTKKGS